MRLFPVFLLKPLIVDSHSNKYKYSLYSLLVVCNNNENEYKNEKNNMLVTKCEFHAHITLQLPFIKKFSALIEC